MLAGLRGQDWGGSDTRQAGRSRVGGRLAVDFARGAGRLEQEGGVGDLVKRVVLWPLGTGSGCGGWDAFGGVCEGIVGVFVGKGGLGRLSMGSPNTCDRHVVSAGSCDYPIFEVPSMMETGPTAFANYDPSIKHRLAEQEQKSGGKCKHCSKLVSWMDNPWAAEMCSDFSLHAMPRAFNIASSHFRRAIWFLLFLLGMVAALFTVIDTMQDYFKYESMTLINNEVSGPEGVLFPAVTIWNQNPISATAVRQTSFVDSMCGSTAGFNEGGVYSEKPLPAGWNDTTAQDVSHKFEDMLIDCQYQGRPCSSTDFFPKLTPAPNTRWGMSYTFNHLSSMKTKQAGRPGGLHLVLDIRSLDACGSIWDEGVRVQFHDHEDLPPGVSATHVNPMWGDTVSPGYRWSFSLKRVEFQVLSAPYDIHCIDLKGGEEYPNPHAARECAANCPGIDQEDISEIFLLTTSDQCVIQCFEGRNRRFCNGVTFPFTLGNSKLITPYFSNTTQEVIDALRTSPVGRFVPDNAVNMTPSALRGALQSALEQNIVVIDIFYKEMVVEHHKQVPRQSFWASVGEAGGLIGLFLGASFITAFEFIEILLVLLYSCMEKQTSQMELEISKGNQARSLGLESRGSNMLHRYVRGSSSIRDSSTKSVSRPLAPVV